MIRRPPRSTLFPTRRSSDLSLVRKRIGAVEVCVGRIGKGAVGVERYAAVLRLGDRSEEHTSELQSRLHLVCRLLLEKKKHEYNIAQSSTGHIYSTVVCNMEH